MPTAIVVHILHILLMLLDSKIPEVMTLEKWDRLPSTCAARKASLDPAPDEDEQDVNSPQNIESPRSHDPSVCNDLMDALLGQVSGLDDYPGFPTLDGTSSLFDGINVNSMLHGMQMYMEPGSTLHVEALPDNPVQNDAVLPVSRHTSSLSTSGEQESYATSVRLGVLDQPSPEVTQASFPLPSRVFNDPTTILIEFYFKETARLFSCYDGSMNPFRTTVLRLWDSSPLLYRTLQSMAAANLVEDFPQLAVLGRRFRSEAIHMLESSDKATANSDRTSAGTTSNTLLAMLMLGGSASWHDPKDLGLPFFNKIRRTLKAVESENNGVDYQFFHRCMIYWELLLSYVADTDQLDVLEVKSKMYPQEYLSPDLVPHPWTGFAKDTQFAVQRVGRLIRQQRKLAFSRRFTSFSHIKQLEEDMAVASELEGLLSDMHHPLESCVLDPEDRNTPVWQLLTLAEIYRSVGLIQIYHIFPDILDRRLAREGVYESTKQSSDDAQHTGGDTTQRSYQQIRDEYLTTYAVKVLTSMKTLPLESGTRDFQPFILVSLSSELRLPVSRPGPEDNNPMAGITLEAIETSRMRHFIKGRLESFLNILPPKPIRRCLQIVNRTWELMDQRAHMMIAEKHGPASFEDPQAVYWMDVMIENGWETTMA
ncbi:hypothetical protein CkaCkLH20_12578 [Colletotrichum karsti]|uniref:Uncharacterized protein n=1 Tax=Colletotrichum karsti TaxID=1095194 RepID=A0A9P6LCW6_9PEZI|nr:uncharacterized protein CkaCkLH20_12578 [Colletotrichum karsti]KAF9869969.1 hypothetical protein CkaCkLH20_12578 [Colletotrichum karsti]